MLPMTRGAKRSSARDEPPRERLPRPRGARRPRRHSPTRRRPARRRQDGRQRGLQQRRHPRLRRRPRPAPRRDPSRRRRARGIGERPRRRSPATAEEHRPDRRDRNSGDPRPQRPGRVHRRDRPGDAACGCSSTSPAPASSPTLDRAGCAVDRSSGRRTRPAQTAGADAGTSPTHTRATLVVAPLSLAKGLLSRPLTALAARARFSIDRLSDLQLVTDAIAAHAGRSLSGNHIQVGVVLATRDLELRIGPLRPGRPAS